jgi:hypothetical protein
VPKVVNKNWAPVFFTLQKVAAQAILEKNHACWVTREDPT